MTKGTWAGSIPSSSGTLSRSTAAAAELQASAEEVDCDDGDGERVEGASCRSQLRLGSEDGDIGGK